MRLSQAEQRAILSAVLAEDPAAEIYLFGSRARDDLKGGDIDLFVISDRIPFSKKIDILIAIKSQIGEQKIDLKVIRPEDKAKDEFFLSVQATAIRLKA